MPAIKTQFPASIDIANLNGVNGFSISGFPAGSWGGVAVSGVGDVNHDGIVDLAIGASQAIGHNGLTYVVFGKSGSGNSGTLSVSSLNGANGFILTGFPTYATAGASLSGVGDINADGIADLVVGAYDAFAGSGAAYVIFGKVGLGSSGRLNVTQLTGSNGFIIKGTVYQLGIAVSGVGDINADGVADLAVGAPYASSQAGVVYAIFGKSGIGSTGTLSVTSLSGTNGFAITGFPTSGMGGSSIGTVDANDDGIADLVIGAPGTSSNSGGAYVIFGKSGIGSTGSFSVGSLTGANGFSITGFPANSWGGNFVSGVDDINDDGVADLAIGAYQASGLAGAVYVIFGKSGIGSTGSLSVSTLTGINGFSVTGFPSEIAAGSSISAADINGDGVADLLIGAEGSSVTVGASYVIFGKSGMGNSGVLSISSLTGENGFVITGFPASGGIYSSGGSPIAGCGDINHDGIADLSIGTFAAFGDTGVVNVLFGEQSATLTQNSLTLKETQTLILNSQFLNASNPKQVAIDGTLQFSLSGIQHGRFFSPIDVNTTLTSFSQQQVRSSMIRFAHDGSGWAPAYNVSLSYPGMFMQTQPQPAIITFEQSFVLINNNLTINQGQTVILSSNNLSANDLYNNANNPNLFFSLSNVQQGYFAFVSSPTIPISRCTQVQIQSGSVQFVHNGSANPPSYSVTVINGATSLSSQAAMISFDIVPTLVTNALTINQGQTVVLSSSDLSALDPYSSSFTFTVSNVAHGYFSLVSSSTAPVTSFTSAQIQSSGVQFVHDGTVIAPSYSVSVSDGRMASTIQPASISFDAIPTLLANTLTINQAQTVVLDSSNLNAADPYAIASSLLFTMSNIQYGFFALVSNSTNPITNFIQGQVQSGNVQFAHDGSTNPPSYAVSVSDGRLTSAVQSPTISFDIPPALATNSLTINQGQTVILNPINLSAYDPYTSTFTFTVSHLQHGYFSLVSSPTTPITSFTQVQIQSGAIQFVHDGTSNPPSYDVFVSDGRMSSATQACVISFDTMPIIINNRLTVDQGQAVVLTSRDLSATNPYNSAATLTFTVSNVAHGHFELISNPNLAITRFTQTQVQSSEVQFVPDGTVNLPSYSVSVSDGIIITASQPSTISFHAAPVLIQNNLTVNQGQKVIITSNILSATSNAVNATSLIFTVSQVQHGYFELVSHPGIVVSNFTQAQIQAGQVQFVDDGGTKPPSYSVTVSDGYASMLGSPELPSVTFNAIPILVNNQLTVTQGQTLVIGSSQLSATDPGSNAASLIFTATALQHGHFEDLNVPGVATTEFAQQRVISGGIKFITDGSAYPPAYNISVSDGILSSAPSPAVINFTPSSGTTQIAGNTNTVRNAIIGGTISGFMGLLFLSLKLYLTRRSAKNLKKVLEGSEETDLEQDRAIDHKEVVRITAKKVFEKINTINFLGYRSEKNALAYVKAIKSIVSKLGEQRIDLKLKDITPIERSVLINEIARQVRNIAVGKHKFCSTSTLYSFFKPEVTPDQIQRKSQQIAKAVARAWKSNAEELSNSSLSPSIRSSDAVELTTRSPRMKMVSSE